MDMKNLKIIISILAVTITTNIYSVSNDYVMNLDQKQYNESISVEVYSTNEIEEIKYFDTNDISDFLLSNGTTYSGNITAGAYIVPVNNGAFPDGYTYYEFNATNKSFTGVSSTLTFDTNNAWLWYGYNQNFHHAGSYQGTVGSYSIGNRISFLIKQPEGKLWIAKDGVWMNGTDPEIGSSPTQQLTPNQQYFPAAATGTGAGSSTQFHFSYDQWLHYDTLMSWLEE
jgi:hypothetical protein